MTARHRRGGGRGRSALRWLGRFAVAYAYGVTRPWPLVVWLGERGHPGRLPYLIPAREVRGLDDMEARIEALRWAHRDLFGDRQSQAADLL